ncbi:ataxin-7-like protein 1 [Lampris incognitus]|uniref:ataxin-7-like protein 1 n=1 Tax=Lampris incognitus TaxID=2546036 RepID=UPI0024B62C56|nr:ataxin-7-like protein 1 [Lampris incognitus]
MHSKNQRHSSSVSFQTPLVSMKPKAPTVASSPGDMLAFRVPKDYPHSRFTKAPLAVYPPKGARSKTCVSLPVVSLEKMPCLSRANATSHVRLTSSSSLSPFSSSIKPPSLVPSASQRSAEKHVNGRAPSGPSTPRSTTPLSAPDRRPSPARSPLDKRPSSSSAPSPSQLDRRPSSSPSPAQRSAVLPSPQSSVMTTGMTLERKQQNGTKVSSRSHKRLSGRVFDPNKHCGVQDPESKRPCTRSLTCKTHSLTHRRAVPGRRNHFDVLLAEHKGRAKEKEGAKEKEKEREGVQGRKDSGSHSVTSHETTSPSKPHCPNGRPLSTLKLRLANAHIPRVPGSTSASSPLPPAPAPVPGTNPDSSPHGWVRTSGDSGRISSDDGDTDTPDDTDRPTCPYSTRHPQPLGCCVYSSRLMGRGHYVFDRRWDKMRLALQTMVEKHLNAQMWRKVPLAAESPLSSAVTPQPPASPSHTRLTPPPPPLPSPSSFPPISDPFSCSASFPQSTTTAGAFSARDPPKPLALFTTPGRPRNGTHKPSRPFKEREDSLAGAKRGKTASFASFSSSSSSSSSPSGDNHKKNGSSYHPVFTACGERAVTPGRKKGLVREGSRQESGAEDWRSRADGLQSYSVHKSMESNAISTSSVLYSPSKELPSTPHRPPPPPSASSAYRGGVDGRKRRSPSCYGGKASKMSRVGGMEGFIRKENGTGGVPASGSDVPRQARLHQ